MSSVKGNDALVDVAVSASSFPIFFIFVMNVFPLMISLAWIIHRISSVVDTQRNVQPGDISHLWNRCYDDLGCVNNSEEWFHPVLRPIKEQPLPRHIIKTTFMLFSKGEDPRHIVTVEPLSPIIKQIRATKFDDKKPKTHLLIHDFTSNGMAGWIKHAVKSLLAIDAGNIISVDWTGGAEPPYSIAVQNGRLVALEIAALLKTFLNEFVGFSPDKFYLIGQGLGAHVAGYVGQKINGIGRITGLDPVGLYFKDMPPSIRLDPDDANFVDIINTDVETNHGQGSGGPYGHFNFFPNGGLTQGGCNVTSLYPNFNEISRDMLKEGEAAPGCSHKRAAKYFTASIDERNGGCIFMGYACSDYSSFKRGECVKECKEGFTCSEMGYFADIVKKNYTALPTTNFYLETNDHRPYCMFAYKITVALVPGEEGLLQSAEKTVKKTIPGMFCATVFSDSENIMFRTNLNIGSGEKLLNIEGNNAFITYQKPPRIKKPDKMVLRFESENNETIAYVRHVEISDLPDYGNPVTHLCGKGRLTLLKNQAEADFNPCDNTESSGKKQSSASAFRQRRNPEETLDVSDYDESEPPEPAEDDYYSNR